MKKEEFLVALEDVLQLEDSIEENQDLTLVVKPNFLGE